MFDIDWKTTCSDVTVRAIITHTFIEWWEIPENRKIYDDEMEILKKTGRSYKID
jgi:hypothetical protein